MRTNLSKIPQVILLSGGSKSSQFETVCGWVKQLLPKTQCTPQTLLNTAHPDLLILPLGDNKEKIEKIKIDDIRLAISHLQYSSHQGGNKMVIFLYADSMSLEACNALLKILEEPASKSYLILLSQYSHLLPVTLKSRCWKISLPYEKKISDKILNDIEGILKSIKEGKINVFQASEKFQSVDLLEILDGLYYFCVTYCCHKLPEKKLFQWIDLINQTRKQLLKKQNPNRQLALENIFYHWKILS
jgi:hypothetical protein